MDLPGSALPIRVLCQVYFIGAKAYTPETGGLYRGITRVQGLNDYLGKYCRASSYAQFPLCSGGLPLNAEHQEEGYPHC